MDIYFDYMGNFLFDDGMGNAFRVIERNTYIRYAKEIKQLQKEESFSEKEYNRRLRQLLTSPTKGNAKELTISDQEIIQALYLGMTTADYVYFRTNDNEKLIEYSVNILLDLNNLTIRFGQLIQGIEEGAKTSKTENGLIVIGQIHGHPDRYKPRTGSNKADSPDDKGIAKLLGRPVLSMEGGKLDTYVGANGQTKKMYMHGNIYYNLPNNQNIIFQYNGARDASSLIRAVVEMNAGKTP
ncbi:hypothetical protein [Dysgonomonas sp. PH5-45]|nr:hypothetical protein [Dysgonomonas sp. PH5-45]